MIFYFIASYYELNASAQKLDVPLPKKTEAGPGSLTVGFGLGSTPPLTYVIRQEQEMDVGFLKLFLTTQPVDYSGIPQSSPFDPKVRGCGKYIPKPALLWHTVLVAIVQKRSPSTTA
jgi:hypothetical protein